MGRTPDEIRASAQAMDHARGLGVPDELLVVHLAVVAARRGVAPWPSRGALEAYVGDVRVRVVDEVSWAAARQWLRG